jgi:hypothetical protein
MDGMDRQAVIGPCRKPRLAQTPLQPGEAALAEPWEGTSTACARDAFEAEWFDRFASKIRDSFLYGVSRVDQA